MIVVVGFGSSTALAVAYGVSVTGTMLISGILILSFARIRWNIAGWILWPTAVVLLGVDLAFLSSNMVKFFEGAWFPLALGLASFTLMRTWRRGRDLVRAQMNRDSLRIEHFVVSVMLEPPHRVSGTAIFLTPSNDYLPPALLHNLKHNQVLHQQNVVLSVQTLDVPWANDGERVTSIDLGSGFVRLTLRFGYMEDPNVPKALKQFAPPELSLEPMTTTFFASRESLVASEDQGMALWRDKLFLLMSRNATAATEYFGIPANRLVELGTKVVI
jgi:KUP system potassium uptake protein